MNSLRDIADPSSRPRVVETKAGFVLASEESPEPLAPPVEGDPGWRTRVRME